MLHPKAVFEQKPKVEPESATRLENEKHVQGIEAKTYCKNKNDKNSDTLSGLRSPVPSENMLPPKSAPNLYRSMLQR